MGRPRARCRRGTAGGSSRAPVQKAQGDRAAAFPPGPAECGPLRQVLRKDDPPGEPEPLEQAQQAPAEVDLPRLQPEPRGAREGVMVVVPALAHADQAGDPDVVPLDAGALDDPALAAFAVREMADQPVAGDAHRDPGADAPDQPWNPADREEED